AWIHGHSISHATAPLSSRARSSMARSLFSTLHTMPMITAGSLLASVTAGQRLQRLFRSLRLFAWIHLYWSCQNFPLDGTLGATRKKSLGFGSLSMIARRPSNQIAAADGEPGVLLPFHMIKTLQPAATRALARRG